MEMDRTRSKTSSSGIPDSQSDVSPSAEELEAQLSKLKQDLIEREHALDAGRKQLEKLRRFIDEREITFRSTQASYRSVIASLNSHISFLNSEIDHWKRTFYALIESRAWKATAPVRLLGKVWRKANQAGRKMLRFHENPGSAGSFQPPTQPSQPSAALQPVPDTVETMMSGQLLDRFYILERTLGDMLARVKHHTTSGKYIHRVSDRIDADRLNRILPPHAAEKKRKCDETQRQQSRACCW